MRHYDIVIIAHKKTANLKIIEAPNEHLPDWLRFLSMTRPAAALIHLLLIFLAITPLQALSQESPHTITESRVKAAFLYKFCLYVEWPQSAFLSPDSPLQIGIAGSHDRVALVQAEVRDHIVKGRPLQIRQVDDAAPVDGLHVLFIARSEEHRLLQLLAQVPRQPLLIITESEAGLDNGAVINFDVGDKRVRFDIALYSAEERGLQMSAQLLKVARTVRLEAAP